MTPEKYKGTNARLGGPESREHISRQQHEMMAVVHQILSLDDEQQWLIQVVMDALKDTPPEKRVPRRPMIIKEINQKVKEK